MLFGDVPGAPAFSNFDSGFTALRRRMLENLPSSTRRVLEIFTPSLPPLLLYPHDAQNYIGQHAPPSFLLPTGLTRPFLSLLNKRPPDSLIRGHLVLNILHFSQIFLK